MDNVTIDYSRLNRLIKIVANYHLFATSINHESYEKAIVEAATRLIDIDNSYRLLRHR